MVVENLAYHTRQGFFETLLISLSTLQSPPFHPIQIEPGKLLVPQSRQKRDLSFQFFRRAAARAFRSQRLQGSLPLFVLQRLPES